jgi:glyoxylase-like metal-dependent hydrolase (beta-lactamase superfamily II)
MKVADGIHKVEGIRAGNAYIVETDQGLMIVDTGMPGSAKPILRSIERLGRRPDEVRVIALTHWHMDHMGGAFELQRRTGARVAIHELDAPILAGGQLPAKGRRAMGLLMRLLRVRPVTADLRLRDGDEIGGFSVIHVPGHTAGSIALRRDDGVVFSGDALLSDRHGRILPPDPRLAQDVAQAQVSAERIKALGITLLLAGHGAPAAG